MVLEWIRHHIADVGFPPTRTEIANHFGWKSQYSAELHVQALRTYGLIRIMPGTARGIQIVDGKESA